MKSLLFVGLPGAGKGTQARIVAEKIGSAYVSSGELFRSLMQEDTPLARRVKVTHDTGMLQPHWLATYLFQRTVFGLEKDQGVVLDGFGRTVPEAEVVSETFPWLGRELVVIHLDIDAATMNERVAHRREVSDRADDLHADARLAEYTEHTAPALEVFRKQAKVIDIDGAQEKEKVTENIMTVLQA